MKNIDKAMCHLRGKYLVINFYNTEGSVHIEEKDEQQLVYQLQALAKHS